MKEYTVVIGGIEHTLLLNDADAQRFGVASQSQGKSTVQNKARATESK